MCGISKGFNYKWLHIFCTCNIVKDNGYGIEAVVQSLVIMGFVLRTKFWVDDGGVEVDNVFEPLQSLQAMQVQSVLF